MIRETSCNLSDGRINGTAPDPQVTEISRAVDSGGFCTCLDDLLLEPTREWHAMSTTDLLKRISATLQSGGRDILRRIASSVVGFVEIGRHGAYREATA